LRNHPSLALWCGNNEVDEAWNNWGWQKQFNYSYEDSVEIWNNYLEVFENILPRVVKKYDGHTAYWPSSPKHGWGREESLSDGDMHYWGVWWGREPFTMYNEKVGRFMSEYGFQGYPPYQTIRETIPEDELYVGSTSMLIHQKHPFGEEVIREFMENSYPVPPGENLEDYAYLSQLTQAYGIQTAIEAHRRNMPRCMGSLYWQFNDCWPVVSWSGLDHTNRWKALHYFVKRAYQDVILSVHKANNELEVYIVSDLHSDTLGKLYIESMDFSGNTIFLDSVDVFVKANSSSIYYKIAANNLLQGLSPQKGASRFLLISHEDTLASSIVYFTAPKDLELSIPVILTTVREDEDEVSISLESNTLVKDLFLEIDATGGRFSDNFFDLIPGEKRKIKFFPDHTDQLPGKDQLMLKNLNELIHTF
jgi:beta-mannosidase